MGERWGNCWLVEESEHTQHSSIKFTVLYGYSLWCLKTITTVTIAIVKKNQRSQITITNIIIMQKLENTGRFNKNMTNMK